MSSTTSSPRRSRSVSPQRKDRARSRSRTGFHIDDVPCKIWLARIQLIEDGRHSVAAQFARKTRETAEQHMAAWIREWCTEDGKPIDEALQPTAVIDAFRAQQADCDTSFFDVDIDELDLE
ncbi:MAG: hypothetical protein Q7V62_04860 [Actinomycetota bacterium]|nr:hypothetical protein [Actinomycetota bacterium]